ncbi:MAG: hypothetical protein HZA49_06735 [Planctomycetes bacterium]|nr:hypothetical protein [Planctomycetota bacterium]
MRYIIAVLLICTMELVSLAQDNKPVGEPVNNYNNEPEKKEMSFYIGPWYNQFDADLNLKGNIGWVAGVRYPVDTGGKIPINMALEITSLRTETKSGKGVSVTSMALGLGEYGFIPEEKRLRVTFLGGIQRYGGLGDSGTFFTLRPKFSLWSTPSTNLEGVAGLDFVRTNAAGGESHWEMNFPLGLNLSINF